MGAVCHGSLRLAAVLSAILLAAYYRGGDKIMGDANANPSWPINVSMSRHYSYTKQIFRLIIILSIRSSYYHQKITSVITNIGGSLALMRQLATALKEAIIAYDAISPKLRAMITLQCHTNVLSAMPMASASISSRLSKTRFFDSESIFVERLSI